MTKLFALLSLSFCVSTASAEYLNGTGLLHMMGKKPDIAIGYVLGVHDTGLGAVHCGKNVPAEEVLNKASQHLAQLSQETLNQYSADSLLNGLFKLNWPCRSRNAT